jgi:hypothetical protein
LTECLDAVMRVDTQIQYCTYSKCSCCCSVIVLAVALVVLGTYCKALVVSILLVTAVAHAFARLRANDVMM